MNNLTFLNADKEDGVVTPEAIANSLTKSIAEGDVETVITVYIKDGVITSGWSDCDTTEAIGLLELAKHQIMIL